MAPLHPTPSSPGIARSTSKHQTLRSKAGHKSADACEDLRSPSQTPCFYAGRLPIGGDSGRLDFPARTSWGCDGQWRTCRCNATWTRMRVARAPRTSTRKCRTRYAGVCFDPSCQASADQALMALATVPLVLMGAVGVFFAGKADVEEQDGRDEWLCDAKGEPVLVATSYETRTIPKNAEVDEDVTMLRIPIGPVGQTRLRTYAFSKTKIANYAMNPPSTRVFSVTLPRPLGLVMAEDRSQKRVVVESVASTGRAGQQLSLASLGGSMEAPKPGDVLRAFTCTVVVYKAAALAFGAQRPERTIAMYGADGQPWPRVADALRRGVKADGDVTLVLERYENKTVEMEPP